MKTLRPGPGPRLSLRRRKADGAWVSSRHFSISTSISSPACAGQVCRHQRAASSAGDDGKIELLWTVAAELVALKADVIVARRELSRRTVGTCQHNGVAIGI